MREARAQRNVLRHRLEEVQRLRDHIGDPNLNSTRRMEPTALQADNLRRQNTQARAASELAPIQAPTSAVRSRLERVRARTLHRMQNRTTISGSGRTVQQAVEQLNEASSNLSGLLEQPIPRLGTPDITLQEYSGEAEVNRRRAKRRKLGPEAPSKGHLNGFSYGYRGQVVSGPLKMEIASCDGGLHAEAARLGREYSRENVLRNDKSVYCTDSSKCNLILRHMGETTFCLKKLVIKAPESGFTAPIQEGMIFVSMEADGLLARTSPYQLQNPRPTEDPEEAERRTLPSGLTRNAGFDEGGAQITLTEYRPTSRRRDSNGNRVVPPPISDLVPRSLRYNNEVTSIRSSSNPFPIDLDFQSQPPPPTTTLAQASDFAVSTTCDSPSSDEEEPSSAATLADLYRRDHMPPPYDISSTDSESEGGLERAMRRARDMGISPSRIHRRHRRRAEPSRIEATDAEEEGKEVLQPHARFFIERERSVVSVKFDPPV